MANELHYHFKDETTRGTPIEVTAPKSLVDEITSGQGPLNNEMRTKPDHRVVGRHYDGQGNVTLDFDLGTNGLSYFHGNAHTRSGITLEILAQLDMAAQRRDMSDPRIAFSLSPFGMYSHSQSDSSVKGGDFFKLSFAQPEMDIEELRGKIQQGMTRAADLFGIYNASDHSLAAAVSSSDEGVLKLRMGPFRPDRVIMETDPAALVRAGRIDLFDPSRSSPEERLAALVGIIYALDSPL